jgi:hypothetical protein
LVGIRHLGDVRAAGVREAVVMTQDWDGETVRSLWGPSMTGMDGSPFALPTGTVTFLLTDVEGSTSQWEAAPESMAVAIARHYAIPEEVIAGHGGVRPVEQGEGDSVVGAFSRASDAVGAALDAQRALATEDWPAGVGAAGSRGHPYR